MTFFYSDLNYNHMCKVKAIKKLKVFLTVLPQSSFGQILDFGYPVSNHIMISL